MGACGGRGPAATVKSCSELMGDRFVLDEAVITGQSNGLLVQTHRIGVSVFETGDFGQHQRMLVGKSRWIAFGPLAQLFPMRRQEVAPPVLLVVRSLLMERRHRQRGVVKVVEQLD